MQKNKVFFVKKIVRKPKNGENAAVWVSPFPYFLGLCVVIDSRYFACLYKIIALFCPLCWYSFLLLS